MKIISIGLSLPASAFLDGLPTSHLNMENSRYSLPDTVNNLILLLTTFRWRILLKWESFFCVDQTLKNCSI